MSVEVSSDSLQLQDRDFAIMMGLFESRIMTAEHIASLYFEGRREAAKKRLQKIKAAGFITERARRVNEPAILFLTRKAFGILHERGSLSGYPSFSPSSFERRAQVGELTVRHELEVMDVKSAFHSAFAQSSQFILNEFLTWPLLYQFEAFRPGREGAETAVKPDGFIRIHEKERDGGLSDHCLFLEVDRSSETLEYLVAHAGSYREYYKSGGFAVRNGAERVAFEDYPFRVLMVFKTSERRNNTAASLLRATPPIMTLTYLSTLQEVKSGPLDAIWTRPADYRQATNGTPFDTDRHPVTKNYKRQSAREAFLEQRLKKHRILVDEPTP